MATEAELINRVIPIKFKREYLNSSSNYYDYYKITLKTTEGQATFTFFQGFGIGGVPTLGRVLESLLIDARAAMDYESDAESFTREFGYNTVKLGKRVLRSCEKNRDKLDRIGILDHIEDLEKILRN